MSRKTKTSIVQPVSRSLSGQDDDDTGKQAVLSIQYSIPHRYDSMFPYVHPSNKLLTISPRLLLYDHFTVGLLANMSSSYQSGLSSHHHTHVPKTASSIQFYGNTESHQYEPDESEGI